MRALIQRVNYASVEINNSEVRKIDKGLLILLGVEINDCIEDVEWLVGKITRLRIFNDNYGVMNLPVTEINGDIMLISQFTLHASTKKGNRPSYILAAKQDIAMYLYLEFQKNLSAILNKQVITGEFGAYMKVFSENDGPVTIIIDSKNKE